MLISIIMHQALHTLVGIDLHDISCLSQKKQLIADAIKTGHKIFNISWNNDDNILNNVLCSGSVNRHDLFIIINISADNVITEQDSFLNYLSLKNSDIGYIDLLLLNSSNNNNDFLAWKIIEKEFTHNSKIKSIGISNFSLFQLVILLSIVNTMPKFHKVEMPPHNHNADLIGFCNKRKIKIICNNFLNIPKNKIIKMLCTKHKATSKQLVIRWMIQNGHMLLLDLEHNMTPADYNYVLKFCLSSSDFGNMRKLNQYKTNFQYLC